MEAFSRMASLLLLPALLLCGSGCSTFNRDWKRAGTASPSPVGMEGRWQGTWVSEANHHQGGLRCLMTKNADGAYKARFKATYAEILSFGYTAKLKVQENGDSFNFEGDANLGKLAGGVYHYVGNATGTNFFATYSSKADHGTFQMQRP
jgi:hypothetical protein